MDETTISTGTEQGASITPAQFTSYDPEDGLSVLIDYFSVTVPQSVGAEVVADKFFKKPLSEWDVKSVSYYGYTLRYSWGHISIFDGATDAVKGIHIDLKGQGCRQLEHMVFDSSGDCETQWKLWIDQWVLFGGSWSRLDLSADLRSRAGELPFDIDTLLHELAHRSHWRGLWRKFSIDQHFSADGDDILTTGRELVLGTKQSRIFSAIYDKGLERKARGYEIEGEWLRWEVRSHGERATALALLLTGDRGFGGIFSDTVGHYINFVKPESSSDSNVSRRDLAEWWSKFLGNVESVKLTFGKVLKGSAEKVAWIRRQVSVSLAMVKCHLDNLSAHCSNPYAFSFWDFMNDLVKSGEERMQDWHLEQVQRWQDLIPA